MTPAPLNRIARLRLLDAYRSLLTQRQQEALRLHLEEDWSVTELAQALGTSRSAAHDLLRRGTQRMEAMEARLGLCRRLERLERERSQLRERVRDLESQLGRQPGREVVA